MVDPGLFTRGAAPQAVRSKPELIGLPAPLRAGSSAPDARPDGGPGATSEGSPGVSRATDVLLTDGRYADESLLLAARAKTVVVDAGSTREGTRALLEAGADVFVASEEFARDLVGEEDPEGACRVMREHGCRIAAVTLGERGYVASFGDTVIRRPAYPVDVVDTTGCGDVFHAGLIEGLLSGWEPERCFDFAAWAAAQCATAVGGRAGIPGRDEHPA